MGKKKNKSNKQQTDFESGDETVANQQSEVEKNKGGKKKKKRDDNWEDDIQNEISMLSGGGAPSVNDDAVKASGENMDVSASKVEQQPVDIVPQQQQTSKQKKNQVNDTWKDNVQKEIKALSQEKSNTKEEKSEIQLGMNTEAKSKILASKQEDSNKNQEGNPKDTERDEEPASKSNKKKKKNKGAKKEEKEEKTKRNKPNKAMLALMKEKLAKQKEEEERLQKEEEERIRKEEEAERLRQEELERERLKKEKKKQNKKDRIQRQKQEGTFKSAAQRQKDKKNAAFLETLKSQGVLPNQADGAAKKPKYEKLNKKPHNKNKSPSPEVAEVEQKLEKIEIKEKDPAELKQEDAEDECWESWEVEADDGLETSESKVEEQKPSTETKTYEPEKTSQVEEVTKEPSIKPHVKESPVQRISNRKKLAEANRSVDKLRAPVICVMGHVDTGKTKILDKLRHTNVQDGEAGGITQQIGATNVPKYTIKEQTKMVTSFNADKIKIPGLLIIDTPGHESFSNLRSRGSSNCDMAILVVDIMHGLENQTIESIKMLKKGKVPFVIALNKIDRLYEWKSDCNSDVEKVILSQKRHVQDEFRKRVNDLIVEFAQQNLNVKLYYENDDPKTWLSMIPTSAHSGDGMGNLMAMVVGNCQSYLAKRLSFSEELQCTVLEVKGSQGLGTTVDVLLINGSLKYGDTIVLPGQEGPIVTHVKGLLMPEPLKEFRVKNAYTTQQKVIGAQGVRISAKDLDKALAGTTLLVAEHDDEIDILKEEAQAEVDAVLGNIKVSDLGVFVQASTLGSLEALLEYLKSEKVPYAGINIGPVHKKDIVKASVMLERDDQYAVVLAFNVKVEREAQEHADHLGVRIFTAEIIYHLFDSFKQYREDTLKQKQEEFADRAVFPCKLKILPNCVFKTRDPIVVGVKVEAGQLRLGTPLIVIEKDRVKVGKVTSMEVNHKPVERAVVGEEVCIKIEGPPGEPPKMIGRHFEATDELVSEISRETIDVLKNFFRSEMSTSDWKVVLDLKKRLAII